MNIPIIFLFLISFSKGLSTVLVVMKNPIWELLIFTVTLCNHFRIVLILFLLKTSSVEHLLIFIFQFVKMIDRWYFHDHYLESLHFLFRFSLKSSSYL